MITFHLGRFTGLDPEFWIGTPPFLEIVASETGKIIHVPRRSIFTPRSYTIPTLRFRISIVSVEAAVALFRKRKCSLDQSRYYEIPFKGWPTARTIMPFGVGIKRSIRRRGSLPSSSEYLFRRSTLCSGW